MNVGGLDADGGAAAGRRDRRLARRRRAAPPERRRGGRLPRGRARKYAPAERAVRDRGRAAARARHDPGAVSRGSAGSLTVYSRQPGINPATAIARRAAGAARRDARAVDAFIVAARRRRCANEAAGAAVPAGAGVRRRRGSGLARSAPRRRLPDGVTFVREAVLRPSADPRRPVVALLLAGRRRCRRRRRRRRRRIRLPPSTMERAIR